MLISDWDIVYHIHSKRDFFRFVLVEAVKNTLNGYNGYDGYDGYKG